MHMVALYTVWYNFVKQHKSLNCLSPAMAAGISKTLWSMAFDIPVLPDLLAELELHPKSEQLAFLTTGYGKPFTAAGFGNWFREQCNEANLPHCTAHGLRKAAAVRHALNGATAPELMAWFGWETIGEAQRYIEEANRTWLAESAAEKVISRTGIGKPKNQFAKNTRKSLKNRKAE